MARVEGDQSTICSPTLFESLVESTDEHDGFPAKVSDTASKDHSPCPLPH
jgi:hypothetical protein